jgi:hypothetical protein
MLRFAAVYGFSIDRALAKTAERLSLGRLLAPPSNMAVRGHRRTNVDNAVDLADAPHAPDAARGAAVQDPREPQPAIELDPDDPPVKGRRGKLKAFRLARAERELRTFPGVISTCAACLLVPLASRLSASCGRAVQSIYCRTFARWLWMQYRPRAAVCRL